MKFAHVALSVGLLISFSTSAFAEICNPDCDPPLCGKVQAAAERDANQAAKIYDTYIDPQTIDVLEKCFAALNPQHWLNIGLPHLSLEDMLGALCYIAKYATESAVNKLNSQMSLSYLDGAVTVGGGANVGGQGGGLKVHDTSGAARSNLLRLLR